MSARSIHETVARGCCQTVLVGTMPLAFATQIGRLTRRIYLLSSLSNVERTCDDFNMPPFFLLPARPCARSRNPIYRCKPRHATCFLLSNCALENSPSNALYDYTKNILWSLVSEHQRNLYLTPEFHRTQFAKRTESNASSWRQRWNRKGNTRRSKG